MELDRASTRHGKFKYLVDLGDGHCVTSIISLQIAALYVLGPFGNHTQL